jgi:hypothetical protein
MYVVNRNNSISWVVTHLALLVVNNTIAFTNNLTQFIITSKSGIYVYLNLTMIYQKRIL